MNFSKLWLKVLGRYQKIINRHFFIRPLKMYNTSPYISFTFDDFPCSALYTGGKILMKYGLRGTYYASLGLMGTVEPPGKIFLPEDITALLSDGHELGCHTFSHCRAFKTSLREFETSIIKNKQALAQLVPEVTFKSFSYPMDGPSFRTKSIIGKYFNCCRAGGQTYNEGTIDLNLLKAFFLEQGRNNPDAIKDLIDRNFKAQGWLIFATHDISDAPSPYGCTPSFFEEIVKYSVNSAARILPVSAALDSIRTKSSNIL